MYDVYFQNEKRNMPYAEDAAMLVSALGEGADIRVGRRVMWTEGAEDQSAGESYDHVRGHRQAACAGRNRRLIERTEDMNELHDARIAGEKSTLLLRDGNEERRFRLKGGSSYVEQANDLSPVPSSWTKTILAGGWR